MDYVCTYVNLCFSPVSYEETYVTNWKEVKRKIIFRLELLDFGGMPVLGP